MAQLKNYLKTMAGNYFKSRIHWDEENLKSLHRGRFSKTRILVYAATVSIKTNGSLLVDKSDIYPIYGKHIMFYKVIKMRACGRIPGFNFYFMMFYP